MEIIQERLEREYDLDLITTAPTVIYEIKTTKGEIIQVDNPAKLPDPSIIDEMREPIVEANILVPQEHIGNVITLCVEKRGVQTRVQTAISMHEVAEPYILRSRPVSCARMRQRRTMGGEVKAPAPK